MSRFRRVRTGTPFEKADRAHNDKMAERLLNTPLADEFIIAFDLCGWKLVRLMAAAIAGP